MTHHVIAEMRRRTIWPNLTEDNHEITSDPDPLYNCIAWAADDNSAKWWPRDDEEYFWPDEAPMEETVDAFMAAFALRGYEPCDGPELEDGYLKVVIYAEGTEPGHMARQLETGQWTSKLGISEDIRHVLPEDVETKRYGQVTQFMRRPRA